MIKSLHTDIVRDNREYTEYFKVKTSNNIRSPYRFYRVRCIYSTDVYLLEVFNESGWVIVGNQETIDAPWIKDAPIGEEERLQMFIRCSDVLKQFAEMMSEEGF